MLRRHLRWVSRCGSWHGHRTRRHVWLLSISLWTVGLLTIRLRRWHRLSILAILRSVCLLLHVLLLRRLLVLVAFMRRKADWRFAGYVTSSVYLYDALMIVLCQPCVLRV